MKIYLDCKEGRKKRKEKKRKERGGVADTTKYLDYLPSFSDVSPKVRVGFAGVLSPDFTNRNIHEIHSG